MAPRPPAVATTRWWWVRHAPVAERVRPFIYGQEDVPAVFDDRAGLAALAAALPRGAVWVTSHLSRARDTARAIFAAGYPAAIPIEEPDLAEQHLGAWQGLSRAKFVGPEGEPAHPTWLVGAHVKPPGGESFEEVVARVAAAVDRLTAAHAGEDVVAVAHGGSIRAGLAHALAVPAERALAFQLENLSLTAIHHVRRADGSVNWRVVTVNRRPGGG
ncbi:MAG: histidine phosphatase family protein [Proteobacteria bacterium]|nr:histidine phosphatase family protein [Pseudomonadota bacterium]